MDKLELKEPNIALKSFGDYVRDSRFNIVHANNTQASIEFLAVSNAFGGEAGELQNVVKKIIRKGVFCQDDQLHAAFVLEAGDALHYLLSLIQLAGYNVEHVMSCNVRKLEERTRLHEAQTPVLTSIAPES